MQDARTCLLLAMLAAAGASCALRHSANGADSSPSIDAMTLDVRADANSMDVVAIDAPGDAPADSVIAFDAPPCLDADFANDPGNCGSCGNACPQPSGGAAACVAGQCRVTCGAGTHECSGTCASDTSATQCGAACTTCPGAPNAMPACVNGACGFDCNAGFHVCNGTCADNTLPATCGASCVACTAPMNAVATCASGQCGWQCAPGYHAVGGACVSDACGNHALDGNEACDDGNRVDGDGCSGTCAMESGVVGSTCPSAAGIVIRERGTFVYSGDTSSASNSNGDCGANGGDLGLAARIVVTAPIVLTVTLHPTASWHPILKHGGDCGSLTCADGGANGRDAVYTVTINPGPATPFLVVDGTGGQRTGPWTLTLSVN